MYTKTVILAEKYKQAVNHYAPVFDVEKKERHYYVLKPSNVFPKGAILTWALGHLVELKSEREYKDEWGKWDLNNLPIFPERFELKVKKDVQVHFREISKILKNADTIINGCDPDREGSNIFYSILRLGGVKNKKIKRLWANSMTHSAVKKAFNNLLDNKNDLLMYKEAQTRQFADWLVGINGSQLYTLLLQQKGINDIFSIGRVQTPTVYMIYQRQQEIENFVSKPFYELYANFTHENGEYKGKAKIKTDTIEEIKDLLEKKNLSNLKHDKAIIKNVEKVMKKIEPPQLHSLATLQAKANKNWKYNSAKTLKLVQSLYEKKILSYPRTETVHITHGEYDYLKNNLEKYKKILNVSFENNFNVNKKHVDDSKVQEHYAIIPTDEVPSKEKIEDLTDDEKNIYFEVLKTTLAMFHQNYEYEETTIVTNVNEIEFFTKGKVEVKKGWKELLSNEKQPKKNDKEKMDLNNMLPSVSKDDLVVSDLKVKEGHTSPPKPYTEGTIVNAMESAGRLVDDEDEVAILKDVKGIGTSATRSEIIETIKNRGYVESKKNIFYVTEKGKILCQAIENTLLSSPSMTAKWEEYLQKIGHGKGSQERFMNNIQKFITDLIQKANTTIEKLDTSKLHQEQSEQNKGIAKCPKCNEGEIRKIKTKGNTFYGCSNFKNDCKTTFPNKIAGKTITDNNIKTLCEKGKTNKLKGFKSKKGNKFDAVLKLNDKYEIKFDFN